MFTTPTQNLHYLPTQRPARQQGFTLLEVLIALLVLSIGLLGLAGLQASGLRNNHSAFLRSMATLQAYDIGDRMRSNPGGVLAGNYNNIAGIPVLPACGANCSYAQLATTDANQWNTANGAVLPNGTGTVTRAGAVFTITITWDDEHAPGNLKNFVVTLQP